MRNLRFKDRITVDTDTYGRYEECDGMTVLAGVDPEDERSEYAIRPGTRMIAKDAFLARPCLEKITIPASVEIIPEGSTATMGGGWSAHQIGLVKALKEGNYTFIDRDEIADPRAAMLAAYDADVFLSGVNAMTADGVLVNIDGNANRVSAIAQGPKKVLFIAGMNKVASDVDRKSVV